MKLSEAYLRSVIRNFLNEADESSDFKGYTLKFKGGFELKIRK